MILTVLAALALGLAALYAAMTAVNLVAYAPPPPNAPLAEPRARPAVSVLIPARDEATNIGPLLDGVLASEGVEIEVIVLDDGSSDGTGEIVRARAAHDARLRLVQGAPLPPGWVGKQHACWQLARAASHPLMAFVDADVRVAPSAFARLVAFTERKGLGLASGFPRQVAVTWGEQLVIPQILVLLLGYLPLPAARRSARPGFAAACGQLLMVRRDAYDAAGGHAALRHTIHDGLRLARAVRAAGFRTDLCDLTDLAACRMYETWPALWAGFLKNAREGMATPRALPVWTLLLGGGHVLPVLLVPVAALAESGQALGLSLVAVALVWAARAALAVKVRQSALSVLLHPLGVAVVLAIQWTALLGGPRRAPAVWRGRTYDV
jgi:cellulose synthase/poly-beta-1,6-N-acetylglucosamine synthase-like glycosyltransferase